MRKVRWGILGVAKINERLIPGFKGAANAELVGIASRSLDRAQEAASRNGIRNAYGSYEALLDDPQIDAVYNPLPNSLHAEWTLKAAKRGKHVLCEKPLAADAAEAQRCVDFCRKQNVRLMDGFMWPHHPRTAKLRKFLDAGGIGDVRRVTSAFTFQLDLDPKNIRLKPDLAGGSVMDVGCYPVYGGRWVFQTEPERVFATAQWQSPPSPLMGEGRGGGVGQPATRPPTLTLPHEGGGDNQVDLSMECMMEFPGGRSALFDCGFTLPLRGDMEIVGTTGVIRVPDLWVPPRRAVFQVLRENKPIEEHAMEGEDQIVHMIQNFSAAVLEGRESSPGPEQAVGTMRVLDALRKAATERRVVDVSR